MTTIGKIDFVYIASYSECDAPLVLGLQDAFARAGKSFAVIGYASRYVENLYRQLNVLFINLRLPGGLRSVPESEWPALEARLLTTLRNFIFPEQRYYMTRRRKLVNRAAAITEAFERLRDCVEIGCMIHKLGAEIIRQCALNEATVRNIPVVFFGTFPGSFKGRTYLHRELWSERDSSAAPPKNLSDDVSYGDFLAILGRIRNRSEVIHYPLTGNRKWSEFGSILGSMLRNREYEFLGDLARRQVELLRFRARNFVANRSASSVIPAQPFYFFPLHVFDDSQITVRNPQFFDQSWIIEYLSRTLPIDMKLAVKLHPGLDGAVPTSFLKAIRKLDNVVLLQGSVNAHEVIRASEGVIVINSTVAFEALLHGKPVLVLGHWAFGKLGMTEHADDLRELPQKLKTLRSMAPVRDNVDRTLYDLYGEMDRCSYNREPIDYDAVASSILRYVRAAL